MSIRRSLLPTLQHAQPLQPRRRRGVLATALVVSALALAGCGGAAQEESSLTTGSPTSSATSSPTSTDSPSSSPAVEPTPEQTPEPAQALEITISGEEVLPNAAEIEIGVGEPLVLTITSDRGGELHVHSKPEQYVDFGAGASDQELVIETPGTVEVEEHATGAVVAVIQAS